MKCVTLLILCVIALSGSLSAQPLPRVVPEKAGISSDRLGKMHAVIQGFIDEGKHAGAISAVARNGQLVDFKTYGYRDLEARAPMQPDTIVRIYSMSKVITSVAVLKIFEEGRFALDEPVTRFIPELRDLKVCTGGTVENPTLADAKKPITIKHLLTHTAGFAYDFSAKEPVRQLYVKADLLEASSLKEFIQRLARLPLVQQPGEAFNYGVNTDVLGYLVEVVSGQPLEDYLRDHIFVPLRMIDTSFDVPEAKMPRLAKIYENGPDGKLRPVAKPPFGTYAEKGRGFASGGGGGLFALCPDAPQWWQTRRPANPGAKNGGADAGQPSDFPGQTHAGWKSVGRLRAGRFGADRSDQGQRAR